MNYFVFIYRKTLYVCGAHSLLVFTSNVCNAFDLVG